MGAKNIDAFMSEIERLKRAADILEMVWAELGSYNKVLTSSTTDKLRGHFRFDDSE